MKYNAQEHLNDIQSELSALMVDLGLNPENINNTSFLDLKNAIKNTYALLEDVGRSALSKDTFEDSLIAAVYLKRVRAVLNARKLVYLNKIVSKRV